MEIKNCLTFLISLIAIIVLDIISILWFARSEYLFIIISSGINLILIRFLYKIFKVNSSILSLILTIILYAFLGIWYLFTYSCRLCYDIYIIKAFLPIPIVTYILNMIFEVVVKMIYEIKNKR